VPLILPVASPDDPRVAAYRDVRERDLVGREGRFVAESEGVLRTLLSPRSRFAVESLFVAEPRLASLADALDGLGADVPVHVAPRAVMAAVAGFPIHRGVLAIGRRGPEPDPDALLAGLAADALVVVLVGLTNHDNVGAVFRNAAAFGADAVLLDAATCDPLYRKAIRVSVGACLTVPFARAPAAADLLGLLSNRGFSTLALTPGGGEDVADLEPGGRTALVLGTEGEGLPAGVLARCRTLRIAMAPGHDSLNVATAGAIALHRLRGAWPRHRASGTAA
jgi:tRNA G18 (ribose-2'-O)-methylase SpoU